MRRNAGYKYGQSERPAICSVFTRHEWKGGNYCFRCHATRPMPKTDIERLLSHIERRLRGIEREIDKGGDFHILCVERDTLQWVAEKAGVTL